MWRRHGYRESKRDYIMSFFDNLLYHEAKQIIDGGWIGQAVSVRCRGAGAGGIRMGPENWRASAEKTGGGAFIQLALHPVNMVQWLIGDVIESVAAFSHNRFSPHVGGDDVASAVCRFNGGVLGTLEASYCSAQFSLAVYGTEGYIIITDNNKVEARLRAPFQGAFIRSLEPGAIYEECFPHFTLSSIQLDHNPYNQHAAFVAAVRENRTPPIPVELGLRDVKIVQAVYRSALDQTLCKGGINHALSLCSTGNKSKGLESIIACAARIGYDGIEIWQGHLDACLNACLTPDEGLERLCRMLQQNRLQASVIAASTSFI